jgi:hypothetical protein
MSVVDLRNAPKDAAVRLMEPVWQAVGYKVPGYMAADLRRELKCSWGKLEQAFDTLAVRHNIGYVADGTDKPVGQLILVCWPMEHEGREVFVPRLYELPWLAPMGAPDGIAAGIRQRLN